MIAETSGNAITANYTYDITGIAMSNSGEAYQYYLKNAHGDVTGLTNENGVILTDYEYDAFGNQLFIRDADTNLFRYCGEILRRRNRQYLPTQPLLLTDNRTFYHRRPDKGQIELVCVL